MSMFKVIEYWIKDNQQTCLAEKNRGYRKRGQLKPGHWCFCGPGQHKVWCRSCPHKPNGAWDHIARKMAQTFEKAPRTLYCAEPFSKGDVKSKKGRETIHFQSTAQTKTMVIRTFGKRSIMHLRRSERLVCSVQSKHTGARHRTRTFHSRSHEPDTPKRSNCFGGPKAKTAKTIAQVSHEAGFSAAVGNGHLLVTRLSIEKIGRWTISCRESIHYFAAIQTQNWYVLLCDNVCIGLVWERGH